MNKRILSLTLALVMILGTFTAVFAAEQTAQEKAGAFLEEVGLLKGDDKGDLLLNENLERRDSVVLLARLLGEEDSAAKTKVDEKTPSWTDVRTDDYYVPFFAWAQISKNFEGKENNKFEPRADLTTQEYATVLLRALGHELNGKDAWKTVMELAEKNGLLENVDSKANEALKRGDMAVMTLNALGATVKGTGNTLADELNIKLPVPAKLAVEDVYANNRKEIEVDFNKDVDVDLTDIKLYTVKGFSTKIENATVEGNKLILTVEKELTNKKDYKLVIKGAGNIDGTYEFKVYDNESPVVEKVEALGTKAIKVTMSEPVKDVRSTSFKLDGKTFYGSVKVVGRTVILTPYGSGLTIGNHELIVGSLNDYAGFKSVETLENFEVLEDKVAPEVVEVTGTLERVIVTFSEDIDFSTVKKDNFFYDKKANKPSRIEELAGNKIALIFDGGLPTYEVILNMSKVKDYSNNEMEEAKIPFKGEIDEVRPEVVEVKAKDKSTIEIRFNKDMDDNEDLTGRKSYTLKDKDGKVLDVRGGVRAEDKKVVTLNLFSELKGGEKYTLAIDSLRDNTKLKNTMIPYEGEVVLEKAKEGVEVKSVIVNNNVIQVNFSTEMNLESLVNPDNYIIKTAEDGKVVLSKIDGAEIDVLEEGKSVVIRLPKDHKVVESVTVVSVRDNDNNLITNHGHEFESNQLADGIEPLKVYAKSKKIVVVEMNSAIEKTSKEDFIITGSALKVEKAEVVGKDKIELTLNDNLDSNVGDVKLSTKDTGLVTESTTGIKMSKFEKAIDDEIAPEITSVKWTKEPTVGTTSGAFEFEIEFTEALNKSNFAKGLEVRQKGVNKPLTNFTVAKKDETENILVVTVNIENEVKEGYEFTVEVVDKSFLYDLANNQVKSDKVLEVKSAE